MTVFSNVTWHVDLLLENKMKFDLDDLRCSLNFMVMDFRFAKIIIILFFFLIQISLNLLKKGQLGSVAKLIDMSFFFKERTRGLAKD